MYIHGYDHTEDHGGLDHKVTKHGKTMGGVDNLIIQIHSYIIMGLQL